MHNSKHFQSILLELAAIVFLLLTAPFWLPIAGVLIVGGLALSIVAAALLFLLAMCSSAKSSDFNVVSEQLIPIIDILQSYN